MSDVQVKLAAFVASLRPGGRDSNELLVEETSVMKSSGTAYLAIKRFSEDATGRTRSATRRLAGSPYDVCGEADKAAKPLVDQESLQLSHGLHGFTTAIAIASQEEPAPCSHAAPAGAKPDVSMASVYVRSSTPGAEQSTAEHSTECMLSRRK
eukprot:Skav212312  [mRNA]  locus=scaffold3374:18558:24015:- [translate_table: standard]